MKVLAVTGGIGSGKSHVIRIFSALGIPAYLADDRTKRLYSTSKPLISSLAELLGNGVVDSNGKIDRAAMAGIIFSDKQMLAEVEEIVHPIVMEDFVSWKNSFQKSDVPFVIMESAIFLEKPFLTSFADKVLTVTAPIELRIRRVMSRDKQCREQILSRINNQWSDEKRVSHSNFVLLSDGVAPLLPQVLQIYDKMSNI